MTADERDIMGCKGKAFYSKELSVDVGVMKFADVLESALRSRHAWQRTKRAADVSAAALTLVVLALPLGVLGWQVRRQLGSPVVFKQERPGRHNQPFVIYKFRTMTDSRDDDGKLLPDRSRLTPFGNWLRTRSLDELPELVNVLKGDMSIVGPRPLLARYVPFYTRRERRRMDVRPGMTGLAQIAGRNQVSWDERLALDAEYVDTISPWQDLKILVRTLSEVFQRTGAVADPKSIMSDLDEERRGLAEALPK